MCRRASCPACGRPTFTGCGAHIEQVLGEVPVAQRCTCRSWSSAPAAKASAAAAPAPAAGSWWSRLLGR
jgi:hypothetical protein